MDDSKKEIPNSLLYSMLEKIDTKLDALEKTVEKESKAVALALQSQDARLKTLEKDKKDKKEITLSREARVIAWTTLAISMFFVYHAIFMK